MTKFITEPTTKLQNNSNLSARYLYILFVSKLSHFASGYTLTWVEHSTAYFLKDFNKKGYRRTNGVTLSLLELLIAAKNKIFYHVGAETSVKLGKLIIDFLV